MRDSKHIHRRGLSVIESVVAAILIVILAVLVLPAVERARGSAAGNQNRDRMRKVGISMHAYHTTHNSFPQGATGQPRGSSGPKK